MQNKHEASSHISPNQSCVPMILKASATRLVKWAMGSKVFTHLTCRKKKSNLILGLKRFLWKLIRISCKFHSFVASGLSLSLAKSWKSVFDWYSNTAGMDGFEGISESNVFVSIKTSVHFMEVNFFTLRLNGVCSEVTFRIHEFYFWGFRNGPQLFDNSISMVV